MYKSTLALLAAAGSVIATGRPSDQSICDYYTTALLKDDTPTNQYTLLTLLVNTVVIGNYSTVNVGVTVPGILAPAVYGYVKTMLRLLLWQTEAYYMCAAVSR